MWIGNCCCVDRPRELRLRRQRKLHQQIIETFHRTCQNRQLGAANSLLYDMDAVTNDDHQQCDLMISHEEMEAMQASAW